MFGVSTGSGGCFGSHLGDSQLPIFKHGQEFDESNTCVKFGRNQ